MECKCGYKGLAEVGDFPNKRFSGKYTGHNLPFRCPKCKTNKDIKFINCLDTVQEIIFNKRFPDHQFSFEIRDDEKGIRVYTRRPNASGMSIMNFEEVKELVDKYPDVHFENFRLDLNKLQNAVMQKN